MDLNRHVNNVVYFRYLEQARIEWFDLAVNEWRDGSHGIVIANAFCNFLKPLAYPATIEVCVYVGSPELFPANIACEYTGSPMPTSTASRPCRAPLTSDIEVTTTVSSSSFASIVTQYEPPLITRGASWVPSVLGRSSSFAHALPGPYVGGQAYARARPRRDRGADPSRRWKRLPTGRPLAPSC